LNYIGHPIIGDHRHGDHRWNQMFYERTGIYRMMLTAMRLDFRHPISEEPISLLVGRGEAFDNAIEILQRNPQLD
jgi:tRNA pseudouridine65 synthase